MPPCTLCVLALLLAACGGGGGGGGGTSDEPPPPTLVTRARYVPGATLSAPVPPAQVRAQLARFDTSAEYQSHSELEQIGARDAHARGYQGQGAVIAVTDRQIYHHPDLQGQVQCAPTPGNLCSPGAPPPDDVVLYHGMIISLIAAGRSDQEVRPSNYVGVAPRARILARGIPLGTAGSVYRPITLSTTGPREEISGLFDSALLNSADILNASFGFAGGIRGYTEEQIRHNFVEALRILSQRGVQDKTVIVFAAGNARHRIDRRSSDPRQDAASPEILAGLPVRIPELRGHFLAAVATEPDLGGSGQQRIASYSNRCGLARDFCLAAPGDAQIYFPNLEAFRATQNPRGTSLAAPRVSGALAVLASMVTNERGERSMTMSALASRLLATADKSGIYADSDIYGQGFLDLEAATRPVGRTRIALGDQLSGAGASLQSTALLPGPAFGDAFARALAARSLAIFDTLDFPFRSSFPVQNREHGRHWQLHWPTAALPPWQAGTTVVLGGHADPARRFGLEGLRTAPLLETGSLQLQHLELAAGPGLGIGHSLAFPRGELRLGFFYGQKQAIAHYPAWQNQGLLAEFIAHRGSSSFAIGTGIIAQDERILGTHSSGAWRTGRAYTSFASLSGLHKLGAKTGDDPGSHLERGWRVLHSAALGITTVHLPDASLFTDFSTLLSSEASIGIEGLSIWRPGDRLGLQIRQPLRVERGTARVRYASARRMDGSLERQSFTSGLSPSGRTLESELNYLLPLNQEARLRFSIGVALQPGHRQQAAPAGFSQLLLQLQL